MCRSALLDWGQNVQHAVGVSPGWGSHIACLVLKTLLLRHHAGLLASEPRDGEVFQLWMLFSSLGKGAVFAKWGCSQPLAWIPHINSTSANHMQERDTLMSALFTSDWILTHFKFALSLFNTGKSGKLHCLCNTYTKFTSLLLHLITCSPQRIALTVPYGFAL